MSLWIKICGVTSVEDARFVCEAGADAIGLNFASASPRAVDVQVARAIRAVVPLTVELVGVFLDHSFEQIASVSHEVGLDTVQLHGHEPPEFVARMSQEVPAYKALRIGSAEDVSLADQYGGDRVLVDAKVPGAMGGTGHTFDWSLIEELNTRRKVILAGGLKPENVGECVRTVLPYGIDTASGVESAPGKKDEARVRWFIQSARSAHSSDRGW